MYSPGRRRAVGDRALLQSTSSPKRPRQTSDGARTDCSVAARFTRPQGGSLRSIAIRGRQIRSLQCSSCAPAAGSPGRAGLACLLSPIGFARLAFASGSLLGVFLAAGLQGLSELFRANLCGCLGFRGGRADRGEVARASEALTAGSPPYRRARGRAVTGFAFARRRRRGLRRGTGLFDAADVGVIDVALGIGVFRDQLVKRREEDV